VEFAGDTLPVYAAPPSPCAPPRSGGGAGASNSTCARFNEARIGAHVDALSFLGGVLKALVAGQPLQRPKVRLFSGSVVPQMPREAPYGDPSAVDLWSEVVYGDLLFPKEQVPASTPIPPCEVGTISYADHGILCVGFRTAGSSLPTLGLCRQCCSTGWDV
jgi:hypothetical protein